MPRPGPDASGMRPRLLPVLLVWLVASCPQPPSSDGGTGGGSSAIGGGGGGGLGGGGGGLGGGTGGGGGGTGGGTGAGGGGAVDPGDAGWADDGGVLSACEVAPWTGEAPPECAPADGGCRTAADCASGLCLRLAGGGQCTRPCSGAAPCDVGWVCQTRWTGAGQRGFCVPGRRP